MDDQPDSKARPQASASRWRRRAGIAAFIAALLVLMAPEIIERTSLRDLVLRRILGGPDLEVSTESASLGWFSPIEFHGLRLTGRDRPSSVELAEFRTEKPLWRLVTTPGDLGLITLKAPAVEILKRADDEPLGQAASALADAFRRPGPRRPGDAPLVQFQVTDASLLIDTPEGRDDWKLAPIEIAGGVVRVIDDPSGRAVELAPSRIVDRAEIDPGIANDLLKFVAPVLSRATWAKGSFSLEIDRARIPLAEPKSGTLAGRLEVHGIAAGPGPLFDVIRGLINLPEEVELANGSRIEFELRDGRFYHTGLEFGPPAMRIRSSGSVGLDETLDLHLRIPIPSTLLAEGAVRDSLAGRELPLHIGGTLRKPEVDAKDLVRGGLDALLAALRGARANGKPLTLDALEKRLSEAPPEALGALAAPPAPGADEPAIDAGQIGDLIQEAAPLVQDLLKRRRENRAAAPQNNGRPLRRLLDRLTAPPPEEVPKANEAAPDKATPPRVL